MYIGRILIDAILRAPIGISFPPQVLGDSQVVLG
jgi:hypothetical protein